MHAEILLHSPAIFENPELTNLPIHFVFGIAGHAFPKIYLANRLLRKLEWRAKIYHGSPKGNGDRRCVNPVGIFLLIAPTRARALHSLVTENRCNPGWSPGHPPDPLPNLSRQVVVATPGQWDWVLPAVQSCKLLL